LEGYLTAKRIEQLYHNYQIGFFPNASVFDEAYVRIDAKLCE